MNLTEIRHTEIDWSVNPGEALLKARNWYCSGQMIVQNEDA